MVVTVLLSNGFVQRVKGVSGVTVKMADGDDARMGLFPFRSVTQIHCTLRWPSAETRDGASDKTKKCCNRARWVN